MSRTTDAVIEEMNREREEAFRREKDGIGKRKAEVET